MKKLLSIVSLVLILIANTFATTPPTKQFDTIVTFGDSLSDNGNLYKYFLHFLPVSPPYFDGRFSNDLLWNEQLYKSYFPEDYTIGFQNYAVGGAGAVLSYKENLPFTLTAEFDDYLYWNKYGRRDSTLFIIWIGGNNYLNGPTDVDDITSKVVNAIDSVTQRIINAGGNKILIANLPDLGAAPQSKENGTSELLTELTETHNQKLADMYYRLKRDNPEVHFVYFDVAAHFQKVVKNPAQYGITNSKEACYLGSYSGWLVKNNLTNPSNNELANYLDQLLKQKPIQLTEKNKQAILENPQLAESLRTSLAIQKLKQAGFMRSDQPLDCNGYLFWDHVHPTGFVHQGLAEQAKLLIDNAGLVATVPEDL